MKPEVADALLASYFKWTKSMSMLSSTSWMTEDAPARVTGGPAAEITGGLRVRMRSGFSGDAESPPQSGADYKRTKRRDKRPERFIRIV